MDDKKFSLKKMFSREPPIWETPQWEEMSWDEKMALWKRHKRINFVLGAIFTVSFFGSLLWYIHGRVMNQSGRYDLVISLGVILVMGVCLYAARNLMD